METDRVVKALCREYPCIDSAGFRVEIRKDVDEHGEAFVRKCLQEADAANSRDKVSLNFYRGVRKRLNEEAMESGIAAGYRYRESVARMQRMRKTG